jgi:predicted P-loop ATPase
MWLIAMVARIYNPGCKQDYMPVAEGGQGGEKSKACAIIAGPEYFSDHLPDLGSKDCYQHLRGKWLIEMAELWAYSKAQIGQFKSFLTRDTERYRPAYGRKEEKEPRTCVFVGTTNEDQYLNDVTGNRRFWPFKAGRIDIDALTRDRDQLLAEAVKMHHDGVKAWPDRDFERKFIVPQQEARREVDLLLPLVADYLDTLPKPGLLTPRATTINDVAVHALGYKPPAFIAAAGGTQGCRPITDLQMKDQRRIANMLKTLGYKPRHTKRGNVWELYVEEEEVNLA